MVPSTMFSHGVLIFCKASVHYISNSSHWDIPRNFHTCFDATNTIIFELKFVNYFQCQYWFFLANKMYVSKQDVLSFIANWISWKGIYEQKIELLGFFHVISAILHFITRQSKNVNKPGSYFSHQKCNSTNVHHATWKNYEGKQDGNEDTSPSRYWWILWQHHWCLLGWWHNFTVYKITFLNSSN